MDYYYIDDKDLLASMEKELLSSLNEFCLSVLDNGGVWIDSYTKKEKGIISSWNDAYNHGIDGYLVASIIQIIDSGIYNKDEILSQFKKKVYSCLKKYGCNNEGVQDIFHHVWSCRCTRKKDDNENIKAIREIALEQQPIWLRFTNCNRFMIFYAIAVCVGAIFVGEYFFMETKGSIPPSIISLLMTFMLVVTTSKAGLYSSFIPIDIALFVCGYNILFEEHVYIAISTCKTWLWMAVVYVLWFPVLCINYSRLKDAKLI